MPPVLAVALELLGQAGPRHAVEHADPVGFEPGILALPEGRGGRERQEMRQEVAHLVHQIDAQLVVVEPDMDVQPADDQPPRDALQIAVQHLVALARRRLLLVPEGEGMGRGGDRRHAVASGDLRHGRAQVSEIGARLGDAAAFAGADLDLRAQELGADLPGEQALALRQHRRAAGRRRGRGCRDRRGDIPPRCRW